jgi:hypothetical protein
MRSSHHDALRRLWGHSAALGPAHSTALLFRLHGNRLVPCFSLQSHKCIRGLHDHYSSGIELDACHVAVEYLRIAPTGPGVRNPRIAPRHVASRQEGGGLTASEPFRKTVIARFFKANGTTQLIAVFAMSDSMNDQLAHRIDRIAGTTLAHATG